MKRFLIAFLAAMLLPVAAQAADLVAGKAKADAACASCHATSKDPKDPAAPKDWTQPVQPDYPRLGGQHKDYLITALNAYKQGDKSLIGRKNVVMGAMATGLSPQDIENVAAYLSSLKDGPLHIKR